MCIRDRYRGGLTYTVKITGTNTTTNTDAYFGFQLSAITGSTPAVTPVNAGTWQQTNLPTGVQYTPALTHYHLANIIEHNTALSASSGSGAAGTVYTESVKMCIRDRQILFGKILFVFFTVDGNFTGAGPDKGAGN